MKKTKEAGVALQATSTLKLVGGQGVENPIEQSSSASSNIDTALQLGPR